ncbi:MAG: phosphotransferase enzyme family protein [Saprospiraceae bacterium]
MTASELAPVLAQFAPGAPFETGRLLGKGMIHRSFLVRSGGQAWVLQCMNTAVFSQPERVMDNLLRVQAHLKKSNYSYRIAEPIRTRAGDVLYRAPDGQAWRAFPYFPDTYTPEGNANPEEACQAARAYGVFLSALRDFPVDSLPETIPGFHDTLQRQAYYEQVRAQADPARRQQAGRAADALAEYFPLFRDIHALKESGQLTRRVTHNDTKAGNVLLDARTRRPIAVIDLDTVMPGVVWSDFGDMARTFVPRRPENDPDIRRLALNTEILAALQEGFLEAVGAWLTPLEKTGLLSGAVWITAEQALRFLTDYLAGDVYYRVQYPAQNLDRAQNQLAVAEKLWKIAGGLPR